jgi:hypothetical protein
MPVVSRFFGIAITFFWQDHLPPHFHAFYGGDEAMLDIRTGEVLRGLTNEWRALHIGELLDNWERARRRQPLTYIDPLE